MITNIRLSNFRAFQSAVNVHLRPITVLIGQNSAGKSSLIKFLLMLKQTLESKSDLFFVTDGEHVQLGTWPELRHTNTRSSSQLDSYCRYRIEVTTSDLPDPLIHSFWRSVSRSQVVSTERDKIRMNLEIDRPAVRKEPTRARFTISGRAHYGRQFHFGAHEVIGWWGDESEKFRKRVDTLRHIRFLQFAERTDSLNKMLEGVASEPFLETLRQEFLCFRYLSAVREESGDVVQTGNPPTGDVGQRGQYAMPHLARILADPTLHDQAEFIQSHAQAVAGVESLSVVRKTRDLLKKIEARNPRTNASCAIGDFGFGVSQCLPIFIQGAMHHPNQLLVVEQPESQLHPTAQLELGSFFADLWNRRQVPSIIETHSGNILLRLRKLISKGQLSPEDVSVAYFTIGKGSRLRRQKVDDLLEELGVRTEGRFPAVAVRNLDIKPDGSLGSKDEGLPMEFFGADIREALDFGELEHD
jgi:hypothetical protein